MPLITLRSRKALFVLATLLLSVGALAAPWPEPVAPEGAGIVQVADDMVFNGTPMKAWEVSIPEAPESVIAFYKAHWSAKQDNGAPGHKLDKQAGWVIISRLENGFFITVQVPSAPALHTQALFGITDIGNATPIELGRGVPRLSRTIIINDIQAVDGPKRSRTILARNEQALMENYHYYKRYFTERGYTTPSGPYPEPRKGKFAVLMSKGKEEISLALSADGRSTNIVWVSVEY